MPLGQTPTTFGRNASVTRSHFALFIYRIEQKIAKGEFTGRQAKIMWGITTGQYKDVELKDGKGNIINPNQYTMERLDFGIDYFIVSSYKTLSGFLSEQVHEAGVFNTSLARFKWLL